MKEEKYLCVYPDGNTMCLNNLEGSVIQMVESGDFLLFKYSLGKYYPFLGDDDGWEEVEEKQ